LKWKGLREKKGIEKSFWAKKFIQSIVYSKEKVVVNLNTFTNCLPPEKPLSEAPQKSLINEKEQGFFPCSSVSFVNKLAARPGLEPGDFSSRGRRVTITPPGKYDRNKIWRIIPMPIKHWEPLCAQGAPALGWHCRANTTSYKDQS
jgi:hypothetical protein